MGRSDIEWTDETWNPVIGCDRISPGCVNCYALRMANRLEHNAKVPYYDGIVHTVGKRAPHPEWTGAVRLIREKLEEPLHWRKPRMVFVNSMSDLFHEGLADAQIEDVFGVMALCPQHTFQVLTKRADRMRAWFGKQGRFGANVRGAAFRIAKRDPATTWPLPNVWLGVSAEDQRRADERIPHLLATPAAVRFVSCEPLLGSVDLRRYLGPQSMLMGGDGASVLRGLDWVIAGSESGPGARYAEADWFRLLRTCCTGWSVPFFLKQFAPPADDSAAPGMEPSHAVDARTRVWSLPLLDGRQHKEWPDGE